MSLMGISNEVEVACEARIGAMKAFGVDWGQSPPSLLRELQDECWQRHKLHFVHCQYKNVNHVRSHPEGWVAWKKVSHRESWAL